MKNVLIIGAGPAGLAAAKAAASRGARVTLAGSEPLPPYWRPRLPDLIVSGGPAYGIYIITADSFEKAGITLLTGKEAAAADPAAHTVTWADSGVSHYDSLVLACGSRPNKPEVPYADCVHTLRTYSDAAALRTECIKKRRAFILGGGVLGLETAYALAQLGCRVTVADISPYPLPRQLDSEGGLFLQALLAKAGITVRVSAKVNELRGDIDGACVIAAAGVTPNIEIARACGIKTGRGITVDSHMRTSAQDVYACGDAAEFGGAVPGLLPVARAQGETAGANAADDGSAENGGAEFGAEYSPSLPSPMLRVAGITVLSVGSMSGSGYTVYRKKQGAEYRAAAVCRGRLMGAAFIGDTSDGTAFRKAAQASLETGNACTFDEIAAWVREKF